MGQGRQGAVIGGLIGRRVDLIQLLPGLHLAALDEGALGDEPADLRPHIGGEVGGRAPRQLGGERHGLCLERDDTYRYGRLLPLRRWLAVTPRQ